MNIQRDITRTEPLASPDPVLESARPAARPGKASPISISWDEMTTDKVDAKLKRQAALAQASLRPTAPPQEEPASFWYQAPVYMALFGILGGLLGWSIGAVMHFRPDLHAEASEMMEARQVILDQQGQGQLTAPQADAAIGELRRVGQNNPYFLAESDPSLTSDQKQQRLDEIEGDDLWKNRIADVLFYGASGLMIAMWLGAADDLMGRNWVGASLNGAVGACLGLFGGVAAAMVIEKVGPAVASLDGIPEAYRAMVTKGASWGALGLFISLGPGLVLQNFKRLGVGLVGGGIGGIAGGLLFDPIQSATGNEQISRLVAIVVIGLVAGLATGLIEEAAKNGWLKVTAGLIAGKQFVLYRNPTYLGSSLQCNVYLFNDPQVGKRHAAVHIVPGGFEIEDLPLGGPTLVNGKPIERVRLQSGDKIQIGASTLLFQERLKTE
jgi:hypothetical protein